MTLPATPFFFTTDMRVLLQWLQGDTLFSAKDILPCLVVDITNLASLTTPITFTSQGDMKGAETIGAFVLLIEIWPIPIPSRLPMMAKYTTKQGSFLPLIRLPAKYNAHYLILEIGDHGGIRTPDLGCRRPLLSSAELRDLGEDSKNLTCVAGVAIQSLNTRPCPQKLELREGLEPPTCNLKESGST